MKNNAHILILILGLLLLDCSEKDETQKTPCDSEKGLVITDQSGRIYKWTNSEPYFYYLGNVTQVSNGINGGYIPCNGLPTEFQTEGIIVLYSGVNKGTSPDTDDPLFAYINLTKIEKTE